MVAYCEEKMHESVSQPDGIQRERIIVRPSSDLKCKFYPIPRYKNEIIFSNLCCCQPHKSPQEIKCQMVTNLPYGLYPLNSREGREQCRAGSSQGGKCRWMVDFGLVYGWLTFSKYVQGSYNV